MTAADAPLSRRLGEVVEANSMSFAAQSYRLYDTPFLGSLVSAGEPATFGVVCRVWTEPLDPSRPIIARGENAATEQEVFDENPQLNRLLTSRFEAVIAGHMAGGALHPFLPPQPPRIHSFVHPCLPEQVERFCARLDWLRLLLDSGLPASEQVIGACLREAAAFHPDRAAFLDRAARTLAAELAGDLPRLTAALRTVAL